ncbi:hypothetical protein PsAD46_04592 [Pseudovibrio sp. Ad46]|nr:hypothetical protein PsAD46_04592 [Pseudovibrio sp. Ad46]KZK93094.1 hypothetical protein PsW74_05249 [Pseudovibrio sp. W74]KZL06985.1 hypothetical protein PsAD14_04452 [Pseudovibrio sp. Ad14]KZL23032.1 hypothetical protein PsWM33_03217 [Pseudovibrio sp. WM33]
MRAPIFLPRVIVLPKVLPNTAEVMGVFELGCPAIGNLLMLPLKLLIVCENALAHAYVRRFCLSEPVQPTCFIDHLGNLCEWSSAAGDSLDELKASETDVT